MTKLYVISLKNYKMLSVFYRNLIPKEKFHKFYILSSRHYKNKNTECIRMKCDIPKYLLDILDTSIADVYNDVKIT